MGGGGVGKVRSCGQDWDITRAGGGGLEGVRNTYFAILACR